MMRPAVFTAMLLLSASTLAAQSPPPALSERSESKGPALSERSESKGPEAQGPMVVERVHNDFTVAPDVRVTKVNGSTGLLAGGYGGWLLDGAVFIGGGGYGLTNGHNGTEMGYGGGVVGWTFHADRSMTFGARALIGGGRARISDSYSNVAYLFDRDGHIAFVDGRPPFRNLGRGDLVQPVSPNSLRVIFHQDFFVAEPQGDLILKVARHVRVDVGVGYRLIGGADGINDRLRGATGSLSVQIGGASGDRQ